MNENYERDKLLQKNPGAVKQLNAILEKDSQVNGGNAAAYTMPSASETPPPAAFVQGPLTEERLAQEFELRYRDRLLFDHQRLRW